MPGQSDKLTLGANWHASGPWTGEACRVQLDSDVLHDLSSPSDQMRSLLDLLHQKYGATLDEEAETLVGFLQSAANRLQNLLSGLRLYVLVAGSPMSCRLCDANELLAGALLSVRPAIDRHAAQVTHDRLPEVYCDPYHIGYALAGLVDNSIKFRSEQHPTIHVSAAFEENAWVFSVRDNGIGIDPRHKERIFTLFKRIHNDAYPGAGVGLAITRQIVEQHGGRIWVESQLGRGASFHFSLPRRAQPE